LDIQPIINVQRLIVEEFGVKRNTFIIAGGGIRDTILGYPVRDWDVYFLPPFNSNYVAFHTLLDTKYTNLRQANNPKMHELNYINMVNEVNVIDLGEWQIRDYRVNPIVSQSNPIHSFDFTMNQGHYYDGDLKNIGGIIRTEDTKVLQMVASSMHVTYPELILTRANNFKERFGFDLEDRDRRVLETRVKGVNLLNTLTNTQL